ncbi:MAG: hypothetical protein ABIE68_00820 [bacterium]
MTDQQITKKVLSTKVLPIFGKVRRWSFLKEFWFLISSLLIVFFLLTSTLTIAIFMNTVNVAFVQSLLSKVVSLERFNLFLFLAVFITLILAYCTKMLHRKYMRKVRNNDHVSLMVYLDKNDYLQARLHLLKNNDLGISKKLIGKPRNATAGVVFIFDLRDKTIHIKSFGTAGILNNPWVINSEFIEIKTNENSTFESYVRLIPIHLLDNKKAGLIYPFFSPLVLIIMKLFENFSQVINWPRHEYLYGLVENSPNESMLEIMSEILRYINSYSLTVAELDVPSDAEDEFAEADLATVDDESPVNADVPDFSGAKVVLAGNDADEEFADAALESLEDEGDDLFSIGPKESKDLDLVSDIVLDPPKQVPTQRPVIVSEIDGVRDSKHCLGRPPRPGNLMDQIRSGNRGSHLCDKKEEEILAPKDINQALKKGGEGAKKS